MATFCTDFTDITHFAPQKIGPMSARFVAHGGVATPRGFQATGVAAGFRPNDPNRLDVALVISDRPAFCSGVFTQNIFSAAPVEVCKEHIADGRAQAFFMNSGCANAATGAQGLEDAHAMAHIAADALGLQKKDVLIASTGVIGQHLNMNAVKKGAFEGAKNLQGEHDGGHSAACAIMTTDTHPKECAISWKTADKRFSKATFTIGGMAKGSGMIMPNMATMIAALTTDAPLSHEASDALLKSIVSKTFNKVTVDGDTSTNDTCIFMANGAAAPKQVGIIEPGDVAYNEIQEVLYTVASTLARSMAADGEGATKLVTVHVSGANSDKDADNIARTVANSPLVKTAIYGHDANWGRIAGAIGRSGVSLAPCDIDITFMGVPVLRAGLPVPFNEDEMLELFKQNEIIISINLGTGLHETTMWTCDLTTDYIHINADYRS
ncbi:MAG: bifunctional glutamate N-acetyltransferase/amino-acid acetyltransferase ArgJ [Eggerthellaceae bacterium]|nr:bifunctional glutamate N-acetyltransferase/amino-acid acetyltransferase ArgJ [Eggerthellaceae bacterium]